LRYVSKAGGKALQVNGVKIEISAGDVLEMRCDVLILKYADGFHGVDRAAAARLHLNDPTIPMGAERTFPSAGRIGATISS
jgi:hypothetical protein